MTKLLNIAASIFVLYFYVMIVYFIKRISTPWGPYMPIAATTNILGSTEKKLSLAKLHNHYYAYG